MGKCIRCGKPCADGETMCSECQAWFQQKTGVVAPKKNIKGKNEAKQTISTENYFSSDASIENKENGFNVPTSVKMHFMAMNTMTMYLREWRDTIQ